MRLARLFLTALGPAALAGCLHQADRPHGAENLSFLQPPADVDAAAVKYVLVERPAGGEEINRRVWDRIDEQFLPFETRVLLEEAGLRVGIATESAPGPLRKMIDDPRTARGHRGRMFALDRPAPLAVGPPVPRGEFRVPAPDGGRTTFARNDVTFGFDVTVRDAGDGKVLVQFVPHARYRELNQFLPDADGLRDQATETFPGAGFEVTLAASEYLVIGTDWYWEGTYGHQAFTGEKDGRPVQRLLVLHAGRMKSDRGGPALSGGDDQAGAPPLASQATAARGARP